MNTAEREWAERILKGDTRALSRAATAIENRSANAISGVRSELHLRVAFVFGSRIQKTQDSGMDQVVEIDMHGQGFTDARGNRGDKREVRQDKLIATDEIFGTGWLCGSSSHFGLLRRRSSRRT